MNKGELSSVAAKSAIASVVFIVISSAAYVGVKAYEKAMSPTPLTEQQQLVTKYIRSLPPTEYGSHSTEIEGEAFEALTPCQQVQYMIDGLYTNNWSVRSIQRMYVEELSEGDSLYHPNVESYIAWSMGGKVCSPEEMKLTF